MTIFKKHSKSISFNIGYLLFLIIYPNFLVSHKSLAQESYKLNEIEINKTINLDDEDSLDLPTNPFEIVDMIRRSNSMNDATNPSDAIDEALKSFDMIQEDKQL